MPRSSAEAEYPIAAVSKLTGVSCHALRVWERRYGFPVPHRSPSGHRRYRHDQVLTLRRLSELSHEGRSIGELIGDVLAGRLNVEPEAAPETPSVAAGGPVVELLDALQEADLDAADRVFDDLRVRLGTDGLLAQVVSPALTETGERWFRRRCSVFHERCISGFFRRKLAAMIDEARRSNPRPGRRVIVGTVQGDRHEGGVLIAHVLLEQAGWRVINLGVDVPITEYERAAAEFRPDALALSFVLSRNINKRFQELTRLKGVPVFVGGRSILNYQTLARRHGLIPVPGPAVEAVAHLQRMFESKAAP